VPCHPCVLHPTHCVYACLSTANALSAQASQHSALYGSTSTLSPNYPTARPFSLSLPATPFLVVTIPPGPEIYLTVSEGRLAPRRAVPSPDPSPRTSLALLFGSRLFALFKSPTHSSARFGTLLPGRLRPRLLLSKNLPPLRNESQSLLSGLPFFPLEYTFLPSPISSFFSFASLFSIPCCPSRRSHPRRLITPRPASLICQAKLNPLRFPPPDIPVPFSFVSRSASRFVCSLTMGRDPVPPLIMSSSEPNRFGMRQTGPTLRAPFLLSCWSVPVSPPRPRALPPFAFPWQEVAGVRVAVSQRRPDWLFPSSIPSPPPTAPPAFPFFPLPGPLIRLLSFFVHSTGFLFRCPVRIGPAHVASFRLVTWTTLHSMSLRRALSLRDQACIQLLSGRPRTTTPCSAR